MLKKIYFLIATILITTLMIGSVSFVHAAGERDLTDDEKAAFIVRDEWTGWVRDFTASLSELDQIATAKIYDDMDFYDMQYRFTEKYKKVPEYLDEDGKPTQKLKDMIKEKRKKISGAKKTDFLKFTANADGATVGYTKTGTFTTNIGMSTDGVSFVAWDGSNKTINSGESIYVWNKENTLSTGTGAYLGFNVSGNVSVTGDVTSMINFSNLSDYCFYGLFRNNNTMTGVPDLPSTTLAPHCYSHMFQGCSNLNRIRLGYRGKFNLGIDFDCFSFWVHNVSSSGTLEYSGTDTLRGQDGIPEGWTVVPY